MLTKMRYRLALDLGTTSLGWSMIRLNQNNEPIAIIKAGVRIFSDGRNPKDGTSLAVTRREARAMRRRRDRLLKRKARMMKTLIEHGFFPIDENARKAMELKDPYALRAKGLYEQLTPEEFARALFHINQRRGFKSNRKSDSNSKDTDTSALKSAICNLRHAMSEEKCLTVGEWLNKRKQTGMTVRARFRKIPVETESGKNRIEKSYDLYIDRAMIEAEFDMLWAKQSGFNPKVFNETARIELKDCLLYQRNLMPALVGRCTLMPEEKRAPLSLPSQQRFRIYQEVNNLRILRDGLIDEPLSLEQRNLIVSVLDRSNKQTFTQIKKLLGLSGIARFNLEDPKRSEIKGNTTNATLSKAELFGDLWFKFNDTKQDEIVMQLVTEENEAKLIKWLKSETGIDEHRAEKIASISLDERYGSLSAKALEKILPALRAEVITYDKAVIAAGFDHHSNIGNAATGEILPSLPYYGEYLQRHVGFGTGVLEDSPEKRFGKIANPTVHIGLNQVRVVVNALIKRYGHPSEVIIELARDLKQSQEKRREQILQQAKNQKRNERLREQISGVLQISIERVKMADIQKMILWEELGFDIADRKCPYSGVQLSVENVLSDQVEIEHILPFSQTLDDSLDNKTLSTRQANRIKGNRTPSEARADFEAQGWAYEDIITRAKNMPSRKSYRFREDGYAKWLKDDKGFLARALNDTRYLSRVAKEYLSLICPHNTRAVPGRMTAMLRKKFGLNTILGLDGEKNRNDHRHHAVDACVIGVTDQSMLQRFAAASANARERQLNKLVETMPTPWESYREHVARAIHHIVVSHKPDHGHEGPMHNDTAYGLRLDGKVSVHKMIDGTRTKIEEKLNVIPFSIRHPRHGVLENGEPKAYKGYKGDSNYCIEIVCNEQGKWKSEVISTFKAYQLVKEFGIERLRNKELSLSGKKLVMRLIIDDTVLLKIHGMKKIVRLAYMATRGTMAFVETTEANVDKRTRSKELSYIFKTAGTLQKSNCQQVRVSPIGEINHSGFKA